MLQKQKLFKVIFLIVVLSGLFFFGLRYARSFFDKMAPVIACSDLAEGDYRADTCSCKLSVSDNFGLRNIEISLDDKIFFSQDNLNRARFEYVWSPDTATLAAGKHVLKIMACDASRNQNCKVKQLSFFIDKVPLQATLVPDVNQFRVLPGRVLRVRVQASKPVAKALLKTDIAEDVREYAGVQKAFGSCVYDFFIPVKCDTTPGEYMFYVTLADHVGGQVFLEHKLRIEPFKFKKQILTLDPEKIKTEANLGLPPSHLESKLESFAKNSASQRLWRGGFDIPIESQGISTEFGLMRVTQERGKYRHTALDLRGMPLSVVWASNEGSVILKDRYEHAGNTVVLDHGCGLLSLFFHLDSFANIQVGDRLKKGQPVGTLGKTGYASGYHLHWEMRLYNVPVDPMQWVETNFDE